MSFVAYPLRMTRTAMPLLASAPVSMHTLLDRRPHEILSASNEWVFAADSPIRRLLTKTREPRVPFYGANFKARLSQADSRHIAHKLQAGLTRLAGDSALPSVDIIIFPSALALMGVKEVLDDFAMSGVANLGLGAQNFGVHGAGNYTGEEALEFMPVSTVLIGHMERVTGKAGVREDDRIVHEKLKQAVAQGKQTVLCLGEQAPISRQGKLEEIYDQFGKRLVGLNSEHFQDKLVIAYEPGSAIGGDKPADPSEVEAIHGFIRFCLAHQHGAELAARTPIIYGGSVTHQNVRDFVQSPQIDGVLVGTASTQILEDGEAHMTRLVLQGLGIFQ